MFPVAEYQIVQITTIRLEIENAACLKEEVGLLLNGGITNVIIDMSQVQEISSRGFEALLTILQKINQNNGSLKIIGIGRQLLSAFRVCLLNEVFELYLNEGQFDTFEVLQG